VLLVHGIYAGSSSYEFRKLFPLLARRYRVVALDLLGCGLSDKPNLVYSADLFVDQIVDAIAEFGSNPSAVIGSSLGAAFTVRAVARAGEAVSALALVCPTGMAGTLERKPVAIQNGIRRLVLTPGIGEVFFNMLASRPSLRWFLKNQAYADPKSITPEIMNYYWAATHQRGSRYVPAHFVGGALNCPIGDDLPRVTAPVLVAWGEEAKGVSPIDSAPVYVESARDGRLETFAHSRLLPHEEEPELFASRIEAFIDACTG
jgi:pimeloyl-ACP methyl ester carboxylesterase